MLNTIKSMIKNRQSMMEAASLLMEASSDIDTILLNDSIILGEAKNDEPENPETGTPAAPEETPTEPASEVPGEGDENSPSPSDPASNDDPLDAPIDDTPEGGSEEPLPIPGGDGDDLTDLTGKQTGEPLIDSDDDLLNVQLDLGSNTLKDVLPTPPSNAAEALGDDLLSTRVDDGFGEEEETPTEPTPVTPAEEEVEDSGDLLSASAETDEPALESTVIEKKSDKGISHEERAIVEAISMGDDPAPAEQPATDPAANTDPAASTGTGDVPADGTGDNAVTAAVKDKVSEMEDDSVGTATSNEDILKKLSNVTKSLEDIKKGLLDGGTSSM